MVKSNIEISLYPSLHLPNPNPFGNTCDSKCLGMIGGDFLNQTYSSHLLTYMYEQKIETKLLIQLISYFQLG